QPVHRLPPRPRRLLARRRRGPGPRRTGPAGPLHPRAALPALHRLPGAEHRARPRLHLPLLRRPAPRAVERRPARTLTADPARPERAGGRRASRRRRPAPKTGTRAGSGPIGWGHAAAPPPPRARPPGRALRSAALLELRRGAGGLSVQALQRADDQRAPAGRRERLPLHAGPPPSPRPRVPGGGPQPRRVRPRRAAAPGGLHRRLPLEGDRPRVRPLLPRRRLVPGHPGGPLGGPRRPRPPRPPLGGAGPGPRALAAPSALRSISALPPPQGRFGRRQRRDRPPGPGPLLSGPIPARRPLPGGTAPRPWR